jgi:hypothetical protein
MNGSLVASVISEGRVLLKISGTLKKESLESLSTGIVQAKDIVQEQGKVCGNQVRILIDMTDFDGSYDTISMERLADLARFDTSYVHRTACYGGPILTSMLVEFVATLSGRTNLKFFQSKEDADEWLDEDISK